MNVSAGQIVAILGTNGAGKSTTLRAPTGFLGLDDARVTEGTIRFKGSDRQRGPDQVARSGLVLVPERDKVFPNLTVAENLLCRRAGSARRTRRREAFVMELFRPWRTCGHASADCFPVASARCSRSAERLFDIPRFS